MDRAVVIDANVFDKFDPEVFGDASYWTTRPMVESINGLVENILLERRDLFAFLKRKGLPSESLKRLRSIREYLDSPGRERFYSKDDEFKGVIGTAMLFLDECGHIFTPGNGIDLEELIGNLNKFLPVLPKEFLARFKAGVHFSVGGLIDAYVSGLHMRGYARKLSPEMLRVLKLYVRAFVSGPSSRGNLEDDVELVALACALKYDDVIVYSDDSDVVALTYLANTSLGRRRVRSVRTDDIKKGRFA